MSENKQVNVYLSKKLISTIDKIIKQYPDQFKSRNDLIRKALIDYIINNDLYPGDENE